MKRYIERHIDWYFVFGTTAQIVMSICQLLLLFVISMISFGMMTPGSIDESLRILSVRILGELSVTPISNFSSTLIFVMAMLHAAHIIGDINAALWLTDGIDKIERALMAEYAALGYSLSVAIPEGYVVISSLGISTRLLRIADVQSDLEERRGRNASSTIAVVGADADANAGRVSSRDDRGPSWP